MSIINNGLLLAAEAAAAGGYTIDRSLRFNSADSAYLNRTPASAGNRKTWTWAAWVKRSKSATQGLFGSVNAATQQRFEFISDKLYWVWSQGTAWLNTDAVFRDYSAWYHIVLTSDTDNSTAADRIKIYVNGVRYTLSGNTVSSGEQWDINTTVQHRIGTFYDGGSGNDWFDGYLADVHFIDGQALDPTSFGEFDTNGVWQPIAYGGSYGTNGFHLDFADNSSAAALGYDAAGSNDWTVNNISLGLTGKPVVYLTYTGGSVPAGAYSASIGSVSTLGSYSGDTWTATNSGWVDTWDFGGDSGVTSFTLSNWNVGSYSNQAWYLSNDSSFSSGVVTGPNSGTISEGTHSLVVSGTRYRYLRVQNIPSATYTLFGVRSSAGAGADSLRDSPTNGDPANDTGLGGEVPGNYCTWNPIASNSIYFATLSNGNLDAAASGNARIAFGTIAIPSSGKWYFEVTTTGSPSSPYIGVASYGDTSTAYPQDNIFPSVTYYGTDGTKDVDGTYSAYGATYSNATIGVAVNVDSSQVTFYKDGVSQGAISKAVVGAFPFVSTAGGSGTFILNAGQRPFAYTAPSGFKALCTANLPTPTIEDPSTVMDVKLWTGDGSATRSLTGIGFNPDLVWLKSRSVNNDHNLFDSVRGVEKTLSSNLTAAEVNQPIHGYVTAFNSDGFSVAGGSLGDVNYASRTYVAWTWDAGSSTATNNSGSISSQVRANASAGFSIVGFAGTGTTGTVGHGLGVAPAFIIGKNRDSGSFAWRVYHSSLGGTKTLYLNLTNAAATDNDPWNDTNPTSTTISLLGGGALNRSGNNTILYCFAPVAGYSAFGSYTGNGSADGPFVYTGMRPRWIMTKASSRLSAWYIHDTARGTYNVIGPVLAANTSAAEITPTRLDILSNGFKIRDNDSEYNASGDTYVWAAFAEHPFAYARAR